MDLFEYLLFPVQKLLIFNYFALKFIFSGLNRFQKPVFVVGLPLFRELFFNSSHSLFFHLLNSFFMALLINNVKLLLLLSILLQFLLKFLLHLIS